MKSIQVENTKVESILEEDIESALNDLNVNVYLNQNSDLFICNKNNIDVIASLSGNKYKK